MCFFFFKRKTAYELRISDWSSDVCSSDLNWRCKQLAVAAPVGRVALVFLRLVLAGRLAGGLVLVGGVRAGAPGVVLRALVLVQIGRASCRERVCRYV